jgi:putative transposase
MNTHCERIIGTVRHEFLDQILIRGEAHARQVLAAYEIHHNKHRPTRRAASYHRRLKNNPPPCTTKKAATHPDPQRDSSTSTDTPHDVRR